MGVASLIGLSQLFPNGTIQEEKLLHIRRKDGGDIVGAPLVLDENQQISLKFSSQFASVWDAEPNGLLNMLAGSLDLPSGQTAVQGAQVWQKTEPLDFSIQAHLYMIDAGGLEDVVKPSLTLSQLCLPSEKTMFNINMEVGKNESTQINITTLIPPGPNLQAILQAGGQGNAAFIEGDWKSSGQHGTFSVDIGWLHLDNVIIKGVTPTYSSVVDELGYPIECTLDIEFSTLFIPTTDMVANMINPLDPKNLVQNAAAKLF